MKPPIHLTAHGLDVAIAGKTVVRGLALDLQAGESVVLLGRNGVGKTTLLTTLAGLYAPAAGQLHLHGQSYAEHGPRAAARLRGLLPQHPSDAFPATVLESVLVGRHPHLSRWAWEGEADHGIAHQALADLDLTDFAARDIHTLSGGERQRVALAALLAQQPAVYLLDEPLSHLDLNHQIAVLRLFSRRVRDTGAALIMVLHDINLAAHYADRVLLLYGEGQYELLAAADLDSQRLTRLYGHPLRELRESGRRWFVPEAGVTRADIQPAISDIEAGRVGEIDIEAIKQRGRELLASQPVRLRTVAGQGPLQGCCLDDNAALLDRMESPRCDS